MASRVCANFRGIQRNPGVVLTRPLPRRAERGKTGRELLEVDWFAPTAADDEPTPEVRYPGSAPAALAPVRLILVDEADRLKVPSWSNFAICSTVMKSRFILIGMPGSRNGWHAILSSTPAWASFMPSAAYALKNPGTAGRTFAEMGLTLPASGITDKEAVAAIIRITGGNFACCAASSQIERLLGINQFLAATAAVVEAARENLVIGTA